MRFTCGNCGRAYVADDRIGGRGFRMRCKRCGHTISVAPTPPPTPMPAHAGDGSEPEQGEAAGGGQVGQDAEPQPAANPAPAAERQPVAGKGRPALLVVVGVVLLAAAGGVVWYLKAPASRSAPPQAAIVQPEVSPALGSAPAPAASLPVEAPARPAEAAVAAQASTPEALPLAPPAGATGKAERRDTKKRAPSPVAPSAPPRSAAAPASPSRAGPESAPIPAAPPRANLPPRDEQQIQGTLARYAGSFDVCVAEARRDEPDLLASPRPVVVTMTVRPSGQALYSTLDDAQLNGTALGACVKKQSARMVFPESGGEPVRVRMPLLLGR